MTTGDVRPDIQQLLGHAEWLRRLAVMLARGGDGAEDVVQDTWVAAMRNPPDANRPARPWLVRVAHNFVRRGARSEARRRAREQLAMTAGEDTAESPEDTLARVELLKIVAGLVISLEEPYRATVLLRFFEGLTSGAIARKLNVPEGTVRWRLSEAVIRLRASLDERYGQESRRWRAIILPVSLAADGRRAGNQPGRMNAIGKAALVAVALGMAVVAYRWPSPPAPPSPLSTSRPVVMIAPHGAREVLAVATTTAHRATTLAQAKQIPTPRSERPARPEPAPTRRNRTATSDPKPSTALAYTYDPGALRLPEPEDRGPTPAEPTTADAATFDVHGRVLDARGTPVADLGVFAVDEGASRIRGLSRSDAQGRFHMRLRPVRHDFGIMSPRWVLGSLRNLSASEVEVRVTEVFPGRDLEEALAQTQAWASVLVRARGTEPQAGSPSAVVTYGPSVGLISGRVTDEGGVALGGVLVVAVSGRSQRPVGVTITDRLGHYALATVTGPNRICLISPGLKMLKADRRPSGEFDFTLAIDAAAETVYIRSGRSLRFRMDNSIWPEILPPPEVRGTLAFDYGINMESFCPGDLLFEGKPDPWRTTRMVAMTTTCLSAAMCPASVWQRQCRVPKYWWLRILEESPPNPARRGAPGQSPWWVEVIADMQAAEYRAEHEAKGSKPLAGAPAPSPPATTQ